VTPEERAVVQAAIAYRRHLASIADEAGSSEEYDLADAIDTLTTICPECNAGGHICPGDGNPIPHGATDCGEHADAEPELIFVLRTWVDVRTGDRVRMPGNDAVAHVQSAVHLHWHVKPGTGTSQYNPPVPLEWAGVRVTLHASESPQTHADDPLGTYEMDPAKPVEIEIDAYTAKRLADNDDIFCWENRVGIVTEEKT